MFKCTWKMRNRLNRRKNQISGFFYFRVMVIFELKSPQFSMTFHHNSKNKIRKIVSYIRFNTLCIIHKNRIKTEGWGGGSAYPYLGKSHDLQTHPSPFKKSRFDFFGRNSWETNEGRKKHFRFFFRVIVKINQKMTIFLIQKWP